MPEGARPLHLRAVPRRQDEAAAVEPTPAVTRAAAAIERALDARAGLVVLLGEAGSGKTALLDRLREDLAARGRTVLLARVPDDPEAVLAHVLTALGDKVEGPLRTRRRLREIVAARGGAVMLVDDAHALGGATLLSLAALASGHGRSPLKVVLAGEPELAVRLREVPAVAVRIEPLTVAEVAAYVARRFPPADGASTVFTPGALDLIARMSGGVPRAIDALCRASSREAAARGGAPRVAGLRDPAPRPRSHAPAGAAAARVPAARPGRDPAAGVAFERSREHSAPRAPTLPAGGRPRAVERPGRRRARRGSRAERARDARPPRPPGGGRACRRRGHDVASRAGRPLRDTRRCRAGGGDARSAAVAQAARGALRPGRIS